MQYVPNFLFLSAGVGAHREPLVSLELALRDAGVETQNLSPVSSILPPHCRVISREEGVQHLLPGQFTPCVLSQCSSNVHGQELAASIGIAVPEDPSHHGYLSEHHTHGWDEETISQHAEHLAACLLATSLQKPYDEAMPWEKRKEQCLRNGMSSIDHVTQTATVEKDGEWATAVAMAVLGYQPM